MRRPVRAAALGIAVFMLALVAGCPDNSRPRPRHHTSNPGRVDPQTKARHGSHEHNHGAHPHARDAHHHHPHPHPHLDGVKGHHHPY